LVDISKIVEKVMDERLLPKRLRNAIVTGGAGFIGSHLLDRLINHFGKIYVIDNLVRTNSLRNIEHLMAKDSRYNGVIEFINADVSEFDFDSYFNRLKLPSDSDHHISHCFHLAATRINRCSQFNSEGHRYIAGGGFNVVNFCTKNKIELLFARVTCFNWSSIPNHILKCSMGLS